MTKLQIMHADDDHFECPACDFIAPMEEFQPDEQEDFCIVCPNCDEVLSL